MALEAAIPFTVEAICMSLFGFAQKFTTSSSTILFGPLQVDKGGIYVSVGDLLDEELQNLVKVDAQFQQSLSIIVTTATCQFQVFFVLEERMQIRILLSLSVLSLLQEVIVIGGQFVQKDILTLVGTFAALHCLLDLILLSSVFAD